MNKESLKEYFNKSLPTIVGILIVGMIVFLITFFVMKSRSEEDILQMKEDSQVINLENSGISNGSSKSDIDQAVSNVVPPKKEEIVSQEKEKVIEVDKVDFDQDIEEMNLEIEAVSENDFDKDKLSDSEIGL